MEGAEGDDAAAGLAKTLTSSILNEAKSFFI